MPVVEGNTAITATGEGMEDSTVSENPCTFRSVRPSSGPGRSSFCPGSRTGAAEGRRIPYPMVHGMKKSDEAGVPMKAANKGAKAPAELPEGRASTKGNSQDQSTYRTQGRGSVSQAVERIRQAATRKPQEKLTALLHHITTDALRCAFYDLRRPHRLAWTVWCGRGTRTDWKSGCSTCTAAYIQERIGRCRRDGLKYPTGRRDATARHCRPGRQDCPKGSSG